MKSIFEQFGLRAANPATRAVAAIAGRADGTLYVNNDSVIYARGLNGVEYQARCDMDVSVGQLVLIGYALHDPINLRVLEVAERPVMGIAPSPEWQIWYRQILEWRPDFNGLTVSIRRGALRLLSGQYIYRRTDTIDLTPYIPTSGARFVLLQVSLVDGAIGVVVGATVASVSTLTAANIPPRSSNAAAIAAVCMYAGQNRITVTPTRSDWVDLRLSEFGGGSGGGSVTLPANRVIASDSGGQPVSDSPVWGADGQIRWADNSFAFPSSTLHGWRIAAETKTPGVELTRASSNNLAGAINFLKIGGAFASQSAVQSGWRLGSFSFGGHFGTGIDSLKARISAEATENWTDTNRGAAVKISATPTGSAAMQDVATFGGQIDLHVPATAPTPTAGDNSTRIATTAWVRGFGQPLNADLTGIAALSGTGFARRTGPNTWSAIELPLSDGWIAGTGTWSFGSADAPSYVININADMTSVLQPGYRIRLVQTTTKYFIVTAVGAFSGGFTPVTVYGGTDYTLVNAAITSPHWSIAKTPFGFPLDSQKWTVEVTDSAEHQQASPVASTWYNPGGLSITIPIGSWRITKAVCVRLLASPASVAQYSVRSTLSASNSSESDNDYHDVLLVPQPAGTNLNTYATHWKQKNELLAAKSTRYMNVMTGSSGATLIAIGGNIAKTILRAECLYL